MPVGKSSWTCGIDILHHDHRYTILPPSPHPATGMPYSWVVEDRPSAMPQWLADLITDTPAPQPSRQLRTVRDDTSIADWYTANHDWNEILGAAGWQLVAGSGDDDGSKWRHPNATAASSASIKNGCLFVYSDNTDFPVTEHGDPAGITRFRAYATLEHGGDMSAAARAAMDTRDGPLTRSTTVTVTEREPHTNTDATPEPDSEPATDVVLLPDHLWTARPLYEHIRTAARSRMIAPDALFGAILARVALLADCRYVLPPIVGRYGSLDFLLGLVGRSGAGKGSTLDTAAELLPIAAATSGHRTTEAPLGSGEGMVHAYYEKSYEKDENGKRQLVWRRKYDGILFRVDEGQVLTTLSQRSGQTTMTTIRSAWSGEQLGGTYASEDRKLTLSAGSYRFVAVLAIQPGLAGDILGDHLGGTPQRFVWLSMLDPDAPDDVPEWPGTVDWRPPVWSSLDAAPVNNNRMAQVIHVADEVVREIRSDRRQRLRGGGTSDDHGGLRRLKVAALLAILDERLGVNTDDWRLAGIISDSSERTVEAMWNAITADEDRKIQRDAAKAATTARAVELARGRVNDETDRAARQIANHVHKHYAETNEPCVQRCIRHAIRSSLRGAMVDGISRSVALGWVDEDGEVGFVPGSSRPS